MWSSGLLLSIDYLSNVASSPAVYMADNHGDAYEPWRRQGYLVKPYTGERGDGLRFITEYIDKASGIDADENWVQAETLTGVDGGGDAAGAPALGAAAGAGGLPPGGNQRERSKPDEGRQAALDACRNGRRCLA